MGDKSTAFYKSFFLCQVEKGEQQKKKAASKRKKAPGEPFSMSKLKKAKEDSLPPPPEGEVEVLDQTPVRADLSSESTICSTPLSPSTAVETLGTLVGGL